MCDVGDALQGVIRIFLTGFKLWSSLRCVYVSKEAYLYGKRGLLPLGYLRCAYVSKEA